MERSTDFLWVNQLFPWAIYTIAMLNYQRVIIITTYFLMAWSNSFQWIYVVLFIQSKNLQFQILWVVFSCTEGYACRGRVVQDTHTELICVATIVVSTGKCSLIILLHLRTCWSQSPNIALRFCSHCWSLMFSQRKMYSPSQSCRCRGCRLVSPCLGYLNLKGGAIVGNPYICW